MRHSIVDLPMVVSHVDVPYLVESTSAAESFAVASCQGVSLVSGAYLATAVTSEASPAASDTSAFASAAFD